MWCQKNHIIDILKKLGQGILTWTRGLNHDHEGGSSRARLLHCTKEWLTPAISPNVGNSTSSFLLVGICVRANPFNPSYMVEARFPKVSSLAKLPLLLLRQTQVHTWLRFDPHGVMQCTTRNIQMLGEKNRKLKVIAASSSGIAPVQADQILSMLLKFFEKNQCALDDVQNVKCYVNSANLQVQIWTELIIGHSFVQERKSEFYEEVERTRYSFRPCCGTHLDLQSLGA